MTLTSVSRFSPEFDDTGTSSASGPRRSWSSIRRSATVSRATLSVLVTMPISFVFGQDSRTDSRIQRSPGPIFSSAGTDIAIRSTSAYASATMSLRRWPSSLRGLCRPGVSTTTIWQSSRCTTPRTGWRVVSGWSAVMAIFSPTSALVSVDLPVLGRPTMDTKPERWPGGVA